MTISLKAACCVAGLATTLLLPETGLASTGRESPISDTSRDYTHTLALGVSGKQGVVGFRLPQSVYLNARSATLNDLRVFDASGAKLAFALHVPPLQQPMQRLMIPARIFPVTSNQRGTDGGAIDLDIRTSADGSVMSVRSKSGNGASSAQAGKEASLTGLVIDLRQANQSDSSARPLIDALHFTLPAKAASYSAQVWLEVSDDLKRWDTIGAAELGWLVNGDSQTLANDRLEFEPRSFRYARLTWRSGEPLLFAAINAESVASASDRPSLEKLLLQPAPGKEPNDLVYRASVAIPVEKIGLQFSDANIVLPVAVGSYRELPSRQIGQAVAWRFEQIARTTFFQITQDGQVRRSGDTALPITHLAEWVVRPQIASAATAVKPALRLSWQPATVIFLANGAGPYTLAFGRDSAKSAAVELSQVAPGFSTLELVKLEQATAGELQVRQGAGEQEESGALAGASAQTRMLILWGVLLLGVAVLSVMGWRLFKQMK